MTNLDSLSTREREVITMILDGRTTPQIAERMDISVRTVYSYRDRMVVKFEVNTFWEVLECVRNVQKAHEI